MLESSRFGQECKIVICNTMYALFKYSHTVNLHRCRSATCKQPPPALQCFRRNWSSLFGCVASTLPNNDWLSLLSLIHFEWKSPEDLLHTILYSSGPNSNRTDKSNILYAWLDQKNQLQMWRCYSQKMVKRPKTQQQQWILESYTVSQKHNPKLIHQLKGVYSVQFVASQPRRSVMAD